jgi:hypothetical protein
VADATAIIGLLVGFLVVGIIGTYIGDQMISATNLSVANPSVSSVYQNISALTGFGTWTAPASVTSVDIIVVGAGGGGGNANNSTVLGGQGGAAGAVTTSTQAVTPGTVYTYFLGTRGVANAAGTASNISIGGTVVTAAGGATGAIGIIPNGTSGSQASGATAFIGGSAITTATAGTGNVTNNTVGGSAAAGLGGGGGGAAAWGAAGVGGHGGIQISYATNTDVAYSGTTSQLAGSQQSIVETFQLGVTLCKIIVIVSIASIIFVLLQKTGLIPRFGQD